MNEHHQTRSWADILAFYRELDERSDGDFAPMIDLVRGIADTPYASDLFAATSMAQLCLGRIKDFPRDRDVLTVDFVPTSEQFAFTYLEDARRSAPWQTTCDPGSALSHLEHLLIHRLRWFRTP